MREKSSCKTQDRSCFSKYACRLSQGSRPFMNCETDGLVFRCIQMVQGRPRRHAPSRKGVEAGGESDV
jgi:hypothetical protein